MKGYSIEFSLGIAIQGVPVAEYPSQEKFQIQGSGKLKLPFAATWMCVLLFFLEFYLEQIV